MNRQAKTLEKQSKVRLLKQSMSSCICLNIGVFLLSSMISVQIISYIFHKSPFHLQLLKIL